MSRTAALQHTARGCQLRSRRPHEMMHTSQSTARHLQVHADVSSACRSCTLDITCAVSCISSSIARAAAMSARRCSPPCMASSSAPTADATPPSCSCAACAHMSQHADLALWTSAGMAVHYASSVPRDGTSPPQHTHPLQSFDRDGLQWLCCASSLPAADQPLDCKISRLQNHVFRRVPAL